MKALICAAGDGSWRGIKIPKCLYHYHGEVILERMLGILKKKGIEDITIVIGWEGEQIKEFCKKNNLKVKFVYDPGPVYNPKHGLVSLIYGLKETGLDDDILVLLGDTIFPETSIEEILECKEKFCLFLTGIGKCELLMAKISKNSLPDFTTLKRDIEIKGNKYQKNHTLNGGFSTWLKGHGAKTVKKKGSAYADIDKYKQTDEGKKK